MTGHVINDQLTITLIVDSINFNHDSSLLCVASDRGTVHLFSLREAQQNKHSSLASASFLSKYFSSSWSFAKFQVVSPSQFICAFSNLNSSDIESVIGGLNRGGSCGVVMMMMISESLLFWGWELLIENRVVLLQLAPGLQCRHLRMLECCELSTFARPRN